MITSEPDLVYISNRVRFRMVIKNFGEGKFKLPPDSSDASFTTDLIGIGFPKGSYLTEKFSKM
jgi:hypothetical protein